MKRKTIDSYFQKQKPTPEINVDNVNFDDPNETTNNVIPDNQTQIPNQQPNSSDTSFVRDPALRKPISSYPLGIQREIVGKFIEFGPYQTRLSEYPLSGLESHPRRFVSNSFKTFTWLEYSPTTDDAAYCLCFLFDKKPLGKAGSDTFTVQGFRNWKRVGGKDCAFVSHMGRDINSAHGYYGQCWENIQKTKGHIDAAFENLTPKQIADNRLRLSASINVVEWLTFPKCAFRGHVENADSKNQGNFLEMLKLIASYNKDVRDVVLANAPQNAKYIAPSIQKQILHVFAKKVQNEIRKEIGDSKFCIIIDESRDVSKREQMAIVIRFVNKDGIV
ncbi:uncharacterized protein LOC104902931 [Beta vulgaris subsp. vulgaris]|uniref:uncharacterized protein LOC104902931 n=1 Tax=Beta vulgaris subsp. vulgaris TaxID=3555 RepID=UPI002547D0E7|nr:uncharacterized protein LOC104902931 [Beta vulgaris subsp. vulgaris]